MKQAVGLIAGVPTETIEWLTEPDNPAVAVLTRRRLLGEPDSAATRGLWERRNDYAPVKRILEAQLPDGSWAPPPRDYKKYEGSLWQIHFLGELWADGTDPRVASAARYAFSRQLPDGSWSCSNGRPSGSIPCLTANVGRALARLGHAEDERVASALGYCVDLYRQLGVVDCPFGISYQLNGYCHMLTVKTLLFLAQVPESLWPEGAHELRDACVAELRDKQVLNCLPIEAKEFGELIYSTPSEEREGVRNRFLAEHEPLTYKSKPGWHRFGFPLSYNSDALEALAALAAIGESRRPEYGAALGLVEQSADGRMRWTMRNSFNGKMLADIEAMGRPSKWLTLRALEVLQHFGDQDPA
ncbi:MAG TPA: hypothetical protein VLA05_09960 [Coriobacteriia bacterium]|nr:hypothetical protein [Coriobacteriia bacterium]